MKMKCSIKGCPGEYKPKAITHTVRQRGQVVVFDQVPAEVCDVCGDTLLAEETVVKIEKLLKSKNPTKSVPMYEYV